MWSLVVSVSEVIDHRLSALGQVGYGWLSESWLLDLNDPVWKAAVRYEAPGIPRPSQRLIIEGLINEIAQEANYRLSRSGISVGIGFEQRSDLQAQLTYPFHIAFCLFHNLHISIPHLLT